MTANDLSRAIESLKAAVEESPCSVESRLILADAYEEAGRDGDAEWHRDMAKVAAIGDADASEMAARRLVGEYDGLSEADIKDLQLAARMDELPKPYEEGAFILTADSVAGADDEFPSGFPDGMPLDMIAEVRDALLVEKCDTHARYRVCVDGNGDRVRCIFFPKCRRGGVCSGGDTDWTDALDLDDLLERWNDYENLWVN